MWYSSEACGNSHDIIFFCNLILVVFNIDGCGMHSDVDYRCGSLMCGMIGGKVRVQRNA